MQDPTPENIEYFLTLHRPGGAPDVARQVYPERHEGIQRFRLADLANVARGMRTELGEDRGMVTLDIRNTPAQPDFSDGSRLQAFADGRIVVDLDEGLVHIDNKPKELPRNQFALLSLLSSRVDHVWRHCELTQKIWDDDISPRSLKMLVYDVRSQLGPELRQAIATRRSLGYLARSTLQR